MANEHAASLGETVGDWLFGCMQCDPPPYEWYRHQDRAGWDAGSRQAVCSAIFCSIAMWERSAARPALERLSQVRGRLPT